MMAWHFSAQDGGYGRGLSGARKAGVVSDRDERRGDALPREYGVSLGSGHYLTEKKRLANGRTEAEWRDYLGDPVTADEAVGYMRDHGHPAFQGDMTGSLADWVAGYEDEIPWGQIKADHRTGEKEA